MQWLHCQKRQYFEYEEHHYINAVVCGLAGQSGTVFVPAEPLGGCSFDLHADLHVRDGKPDIDVLRYVLELFFRLNSHLQCMHYEAHASLFAWVC